MLWAWPASTLTGAGLPLPWPLPPPPPCSYLRYVAEQAQTLAAEDIAAVTVLHPAVRYIRHASGPGLNQGVALLLLLCAAAPRHWLLERTLCRTSAGPLDPGPPLRLPPL